MALVKTEFASPPLEGTIQELADWFAENEQQVNEQRSAFYVMSKRLTDYYKAAGPIRTEQGLLTMIPNGYEWDENAAAMVMPSLVTNAEVTFTGSLNDVERALSLVTEECPKLEFECRRTIDKKEAARVLRFKGEGADALEQCRTAKGKLGIQR